MENKIKNSEAEEKIRQLIANYCEEAGEAQLPIEFRLVTNATIRKRGAEDVLGLRLPKGKKRHTRLVFPKTPEDRFLCYMDEDYVLRCIEEADLEYVGALGYELTRARLLILYARKTNRNCTPELLISDEQDQLMHHWIEHKAEYSGLYFMWKQIGVEDVQQETIHEVVEKVIPEALKRVRIEVKKQTTEAVPEAMHLIALLRACREVYPYELGYEVVGPMLRHYGWVKSLYLMFSKHTRMEEMLAHFDELKQMLDTEYPAYWINGSD